MPESDSSVVFEGCLTDATLTEDLREAFHEIVSCPSEIGSLDFTVRSALPKLTEGKLVKKWICLLIKVFRHLHSE